MKLSPDVKDRRDASPMAYFAPGERATIRIGTAHADVDRVAAETVADEIRAAGCSVRIEVGDELPDERDAIIYLGRIDDSRALADLLVARRLAFDAAMGDEGYVIDVATGRVVIAARTGAGLYYGAQTLRQLVVPRDGAPRAFAIPAVTIRDWPAMRWRGVQDDVSRGPVPTVAYVKEQIQTLAEYKVNLYSLYVETAFVSQRHPLLAAPGAGFTADELRDIVAFARRHHVTVLPQQQTFGHMHGVLIHERYRDLAERPHGHVLAPGAASNELIDDLVREQLDIFPGPLFHVGADETFELGHGKTAARAAAEGLGPIYLEHLNRLAGVLGRAGKQMLFWGDVARAYPELLGALPRNAIAVAWNYDPLDSFDHEIEPFRAAGLRTFVAPGTSSWNTIHPNLAAAFINIKNFVRDGHERGSLGALVTTWDDDGDSLFDLTWPALLFGAACAWQGGASSIEAFEDAYDWAFYRNGDDDHSFRDVLRQLARPHVLMSAVQRGPSNDALWLDPFTPEGARYIADTLPQLGEVRLAAETALEDLRNARRQAARHIHTLAALELAARRLDLYALKFQLADEIVRAYWDAYLAAAEPARVAVALNEVSGIDGRLQDLRDLFLEVRALHEAAWPRENRPHYLASILVRYDRMALDLQGTIQAVVRARFRYRTDRSLPHPGELGFGTNPPDDLPGR